MISNVDISQIIAARLSAIIGLSEFELKLGIWMT
jgi:hypothetical protein